MGRRASCRPVRQHHKPLFVAALDRTVTDVLVTRIRLWLAEAAIEVLNVAGPRESSVPGIEIETSVLMQAVLSDCAAQPLATHDAAD